MFFDFWTNKTMLLYLTPCDLQHYLVLLIWVSYFETSATALCATTGKLCYCKLASISFCIFSEGLFLHIICLELWVRCDFWRVHVDIYINDTLYVHTYIYIYINTYVHANIDWIQTRLYSCILQNPSATLAILHI